MRLRRSFLLPVVPVGKRSRTVLKEWFNSSELLLAGGWIVLMILLLTFAMWLLILDRYLYLWRGRSVLIASAFARWQRLRSQDPRANRRLRVAITRGAHDDMGRWLGTIQVITAILPLLGLLGTVSGMIKTFEVMTVFGTGNVRGMAEGISQALITTMAGLLAALSGMYFANDLKQRIRSRSDHLAEHLGMEGEAAS